MHNDWTPGDYGDTIAEIRRALDLSMQDVARLAGVSRSQASRWSHGKHQPAYASVRQLAVAVRRRDHDDLADKLMKSAGYGALPEGEPEPGPFDDLYPLHEDWEAGVLADPDLPDRIKRDLIQDSRRARVAHAARKQSQKDRSLRDRAREAG